ncbi:glycoside hydrolase 43 family protein [Butyrivibrio sp. DSM 10294]|uniref:glycoside hydrolase family 43 protein n=1 Tax=Butyrivibrio sp. DSM 10294 TaxID=2972457 RepID=UPI00234F8F7A|nr:glycoside hydrolase 43 family protein [Butyrivibrio sp. DSM 10294]MDC7295117.1 glycoside hydrolase 43 family protein [Butyrivibrio sp. DSM 10294]
MHYSDQGNGRFRNPILFADYSDPDVIRVGDTYYMTASSFNYTPGLPILVSKDLVNWKLVNYALKNIPGERFNIPRHSEGVWAPSIRYHEGMFYIYYGMPDEGYFVVRTKDPYGEWEEPVCVLEGKGLIDPCPIWDDDGRAYVIHGYAKSRIGFKSILGVFEMSPDGLKAISEDHFIFDGNDPKHPAVTIEGPKVYKRDGYYYIWAPAGGVKDGWQVVLRSRDIHGPYEIKEVMHTGNTVINGPHQGGLVDTVNGDEWFIHFQDRGLYGRICHLQPVSWDNGWPIVGVNPDENKVGEPVFERDKPDTGAGDEEKMYLESSDDFVGGNYGLCWQWLGNHTEAFCQQKNFRRNGLRLNALNVSGEENPIIWRSANVLTQKLVFPVFETEIQVDISGLKAGERAGICMTGGQYVAAYFEKGDNDEFVLKIAESEGGDADKIEVVKKVIRAEKIGRGSLFTFLLTFSLNEEAESEQLYYQNVHSPLTGENPALKIKVKGDGLDYTDLGVNYTPSDHTWVGAKIGLFAISKSTDMTGNSNGYADFLFVKTREL